SAPLRQPEVPRQPAKDVPELVRIEAPDGCRRFVGRLVGDVTLGPSPAWMQARLRAVNVRPISNVVDVTNYVMFETGQPMHGFDYRRLAGGRLVVRRARDGESLTCLDGRTRLLSSADMVVADAERAQALAGIIGGTESSVEPRTKEVLLEAATWEPRSVRASARRAGLRTEASQRFEKGLSPALSLPAVDRAAALLEELAGGRPTQAADVYPGKLQQPMIEVSSDRIDRVLGVAVEASEAAKILDRWSFSVKRSKDALQVRPPDFRLDCAISEDVVEEVGRIYGYDRVPSTLPGERTPVRDLYQSQDADEVAREVLAGRELDEAVSNSLVSSTGTSDIGMPAAPRSLVRIENPMAENRDALRRSLLPGLLEALAFNARQDQPGARLFELGWGFWKKTNNAVDEPRLLAIAIHIPSGAGDAAAAELRALQATVATVRNRLAVTSTDFRQAEAAGFHPGRSAEVLDAGEPIGIVGEVHPAALAEVDLPGRAVAAEVLFDRLTGGGRRAPQARPLPRFP